MCTIDASKAFDRVNLFVLFNLLRKRNFCPLYLRFLMYSYCNQRMSQMEQFEFKRISSFKWGKTGWGIITIVILCIFR